ncbi:hypothetical protein CRYUN_Cryun07bG0109700 [Craigia yunnanensis]
MTLARIILEFLSFVPNLHPLGRLLHRQPLTNPCHCWLKQSRKVHSSRHSSSSNIINKWHSSTQFHSDQPFFIRKLPAYIHQHDACLPLLIVAETFTFAARLLVPKTSKIDTIVKSLLSEQRLTHLANTKLTHGLSGGERRHVSIGLSLLHDPAVLLLDEPISGLDSTSAFNVMLILKSIVASCHRTVILYIHQQSFKIFSTIDRILLLSKGTVVHHGTLRSLQAFLKSNGFTVPP